MHQKDNFAQIRSVASLLSTIYNKSLLRESYDVNFLMFKM